MTNQIRARVVVCLGVALSTMPSVAAACPVCFSAQNEENRAAFVLMTVFLTLLPLGMLGLGLGWAWRRMQQQDQGAAPEAISPLEPKPTAASSSPNR